MSQFYVKSKLTNNFKGLDNTNKYNSETYNALLAKQDFNNAAEYLNQFRFTQDDPRAAKHRMMVNNLRRQAKLIKSQTANMTDDQRDAYAFDYAIKNNLTLPTESVVTGQLNQYTKRYNQSLDDIGGSESTKIRFAIEQKYDNAVTGAIMGAFHSIFGTPDGETSDKTFFKELGIEGNYEEGIAELGGEYSERNGITYITFDKSNKNLLNFLSAGKSVVNRNIGITGIENRNGKEIIHSISDVDGVGARYGDLYLEHTAMGNVINVINDARKNADLDSTQSAHHQEMVESTLLGTGFVSAAHARLEHLHDIGAVGDTYYEKKRKSLDDQALKHLTAKLDEYEVYYDSGEDGVLSGVYGSDQKNIISEEIKSAIANNALKLNENVEFATINGVSGVWIEIPPKESNKDRIEAGRFDYDTNTGEGHSRFLGDSKSRATHVFIPGLFGGEAEEAIENDPKTRALKTTKEIRSAGYDYDISGGRTISSNGDGTYTLKTVDKHVLNNRNESIRQLGTKLENKSEAEIQNILAKEMTANDLAESIMFDMVNENGELDTSKAKDAILAHDKEIKSAVARLADTTDVESLSVFGNEILELVSKLLGVNFIDL